MFFRFIVKLYHYGVFWNVITGVKNVVNVNIYSFIFDSFVKSHTGIPDIRDIQHAARIRPSRGIIVRVVTDDFNVIA